ncbi:MAG: SDR family NAD(P)-dependent oxidoreductase, partial [Verrucomicrobia bacterium]|nr:SDR family NAD(P)-dependent oxidoreductase [Verrucomicrobiota bacterium]
GICRSYGEGANGFVPGEGVGAAILKPLSRALADGDHIYGVIKGTAVNHGGRTNGYTVPNPSAQAALIRRALDRAGVSARSISYIEGHGTGTSLGDPIEVEGLTEAFRADTAESGFCRIGSMKTNLGHLESAAGIAAVTKTLLQMIHRRLVPSLHADQLNPHIEFEPGPFRVQRCLEEWRPSVEGEGATVKRHPRRAGVSSFGAGGANAHVILEEAPERSPSETALERRLRLIVLSARTEEQLRTYAERLVSRLESGDPGLDLAAVAFTLQVGREPQDERLALIASSVEETVAKLRAFLAGAPEGEGWWRGRASRPSDALRILMDGDEGGGLVRRMLEAGDLEKCARLWVAGVPLEWLRLYPSGRPKRVSLPTYPFKKERYWISEKAASGRAPAEASPVPTARRWASFHPVWRSVPLAADAGSSDTTDLVVVTRNESWYRELKNCGCFQNVIWVRPGAVSADPGNGEFELRLDAPEDFERLCQKLRDRDLARHFVWLPPARESENPGADLDWALTETLLGPHLLIQALLRHDAQASPRLIFTTARDRGGIDPRHGLMAGYIKALRLEHPLVDARWLSLGQIEGGALSRILAMEFRAAPSVGTEVRYEGSKRFVREMEICPTTVGGEGVLRPGGRYLITGGAGGLGMIFADYLVKTFKAKLILAGRSALSPEKQSWLDQSKSLGGVVRYVKGDVADRNQTAEMVREANAAFGGLDGVIHAAGVLEYGRLAIREPAAMRRALAAKVDGTVWLDEATRDLKLDFFAVFSSLAAVVGVSEACDYAAGNAFLDHFAIWREELRAAGKRQGKCVSINWPHWRDGGMKSSDPAVAANWELWARRVQGLELLATASGIEAFVEALRGSEPQRCVVEGDLTKAAAMLRRAPGASAVDATNSTTTKHDWRDSLEADLIRLVGELLKVKPEDVDFEANLSEFGFDSLTLKALADRVNRLFGLALMPSLFFSHP